MAIAGIFSALGNWVNFTAVIKAPNPGFAGTIKSTNILFITIFSVLIFGSSWSLMKLVGVVLVILGIAALVIDKNHALGKKTDKAFLKWDALAFIGALSVTVAILGVKGASQIGFSQSEINLFMFAVNFLAFSFLTRKEVKSYFKDKIRLKGFLPIVFLAAVFSFVGNILNVKGVAAAPNPGYHMAIQNTQILITTLISIPLFGIKFDMRKILGVFIVLFGIIILVV
jgi:drug/metabolite transporter (DMT)-like permease